MTILGSAYHEVALANSRLRTENERLRSALQQIFDRDSQAGDGWCSMIARKALAKEEK